MKSKASIKGHPIHPILIAFPVAFYTGALLFDILGVTSDSEFHKVAYYLNIASIVSAVLAAVPGIIDYIFVVPPESSAKKRAGIHGVANVVALLLVVIALLYRIKAETPSAGVLILLESIGVGLTGFAGWLGGTLVYRNQIGVDIRYANAGKWKEEYFVAHNKVVQVGAVDELKPNQMKLVHVDGKRIVIAKTETEYVAFDDFCTHKGGSLAGGSMMCGTVQCPWHGSQFDVKTGAVKAGPAKNGIGTYVLKSTNNMLYLHLK